jgi:hypothetical protein
MNRSRGFVPALCARCGAYWDCACAQENETAAAPPAELTDVDDLAAQLQESLLREAEKLGIPAEIMARATRANNNAWLRRQLEEGL